MLIKLAERTAGAALPDDRRREMTEPRQQAAREVLDLFAPLANRLGVWQLKWELEDLSLRALEPDDLQGDRDDAGRAPARPRSATSRTSSRCCARELAAAGIRAEITGRPKHIYSIWNKMRRKQSGIDSLYDIRAVRILVDDVKDCYAALGIVHHLWTPLPGEFDDYIAKPKANDYRSLHTAVIGPEGKPLEVQIRTREMHQHSEYGVAAHWRYKEGAQKGMRRDPAFEDRIAWLRQVLDWKDAVADASEWLAAFKSSLFTDTIYVLTPQGKVIDLPRRRDAGRFRVRGAHEPRPSLPRRARRRRDGAAQSRAQERPARRDRRGEAGRAVARLAQSGAGLRAQPPRARQGAAVVQGAAARGDARPGPRDRRARAAARGRHGGEPRRGRGEGRLRARPTSSTSPSGAPSSTRGRSSTAIRAVRAARRRARAGSRAGGRRAAEQGGRRGQRHPRRRRRPADDQSRALLQARAARRHRRLRHARQGRHDPSPALQQRRAHARARARAADRRRLGQAARRGVPRRRRARGDGPAGTAARRHRDLLARADQPSTRRRTSDASPASARCAGSARASSARSNARCCSRRRRPPTSSAFFVQAVSGGSLYRKSSFLLDSLGTQVFSPHVYAARGAAPPARARQRAVRQRRRGDRAARRRARRRRAAAISSARYSARKLGMARPATRGGSHNLVLVARRRRSAGADAAHGPRAASSPSSSGRA